MSFLTLSGDVRMAPPHNAHRAMHARRVGRRDDGIPDPPPRRDTWVQTSVSDVVFSERKEYQEEDTETPFRWTAGYLFEKYLVLEDRMRGALEKRFYQLGVITARWPLLVILAGLVITVACGTGLLSATTESRTDKLWVPQDSLAIKHKEFVEEHFGSVPRLEDIIVTAKEEGEDVLTKEALREVFLITERLYAQVAKGGATLSSLCITAWPGGPCYGLFGTSYWGSTRALMEADPDLHATVSSPNATNEFGLRIVRNQVIGGVEFEADDQSVSSAKAIHLLFYLKKPLDGQNELQSQVEDWEGKFLDVCEMEYDNILLKYQAERSIEDEMDRCVAGDVLLYGVCYIAMTVYTASALGRFHPIYARSLLSVSGIVTILCGIISGFGIASLLVFSSSLVSTLPFIIVGIGVDNIFIMNGFMEQTDPGADLHERIAEMMGKSGLTVSLASGINLFAFLLGLSSTMPAVRSFCIFAAFCVSFCYLYTITMFPAFFSLDERRINARRYDLVPCGRAPPSMVKTTANQAPGLVQTVIEKYYVPTILSRTGKICVVAGFSALLVIGILGATRVDNNFSTKDLVPDDSYLVDAFDADDLYFGEVGYALDIILHGFPPQVRANQDGMHQLQHDLETFEYITPPVSSWYDYYLQWLAVTPYSGLLVEGKPPTDAYFIEWLKVFLGSSHGAGVRSDVIFSEDGAGDTIIASRFRTTHHWDVKLSNPDVNFKAMGKTRDFVKSGPNRGDVTGFPFSLYYIYFEQTKQTQTETVRTLILAAIAVFVMATIFLYHPGAAAIVVLMIVMIDVDLIGWMYFVGVPLNAISLVEIIMAVGLSVDYCVHIALRFVLWGGTRDERASHAITSVGTAVMSGAFSSFLGVTVLAFSKSTIFRIFFKMFAGIILLGFMHGFVLLPVVLSICGPLMKHTIQESEQCNKEGKQKDIEMMVPEKGVEFE